MLGRDGALCAILAGWRSVLFTWIQNLAFRSFKQRPDPGASNVLAAGKAGQLLT